MSSNLPPGVTDSMIPGNRPDDIAWERLHEWIDEMFDGFTFEEATRAIKIGQAAVCVEADDIKAMVDDAVDDAVMTEQRTREES